MTAPKPRPPHRRPHDAPPRRHPGRRPARLAGTAAASKRSDPFAVCNDRGEHPTDGRRLLRLPQMYEALGEPAGPEAAAPHFPTAMATAAPGPTIFLDPALSNCRYGSCTQLRLLQ